MFTSVYSVILWHEYFDGPCSKIWTAHFLGYDEAKKFAEDKAKELFAGRYINHDKKTYQDGSFSESWCGSDQDKMVDFCDFAWATNPRGSIGQPIKDRILFYDVDGLTEEFESYELFEEFIKKSQNV